MTQQACRNCHSEEERPVFCDLGHQPLSNNYLTKDQLDEPTVTYPLVPTLCCNCGLIQLPSFAEPDDIFQDYSYFSSQSDHFVKHVHDYARDMQDILALDENNRVLEVASNDGALLREFRALGVPAVGVEPARNVARLAQLEGLATIDEFMGVKLATTLISQGYPGADLIAANNVMAHVPDLDDFLNGIRMLLAPGGIFTVEFPDAALLVKENQFDQIYHEHFSYFTEHSAFDVLARRGLNIFRMDRFPIHGGTIRLTAKAGGVWEQPEHIHGAPFGHPTAEDLSYADEPPKYRRQWLEMLLKWRDEGKRIVGYGAPAKGNTMLNYCGVDADIIQYVVDSTPAKQGKFLPGSRIPIFPPEAIELDNPDVIVIMAWNWTEEIFKKIQHHKERGATIVSRLEVL